MNITRSQSPLYRTIPTIRFSSTHPDIPKGTFPVAQYAVDVYQAMETGSSAEGIKKVQEKSRAGKLTPDLEARLLKATILKKTTRRN